MFLLSNWQVAPNAPSEVDAALHGALVGITPFGWAVLVMFIWRKQPNNGRRYPLEQASTMHSNHLNLRTWMQINYNDSRQWLVGRQTGTVKYPHHEAAFFWAEVSNGLSAMEYGEVSQASTMIALILSKNPRRNLPADQAAMGFAQVLEGAVRRTTGKKNFRRFHHQWALLPVNAHFLLVSGIPFFFFVVAEEVEKRLVGCVSGSSTTLKTGIDTSTEAGPKLKPVWSIDPCWSMFLGPWCSYLRTLPQKKTLRPAAGRMILHRILCRILRCDSVSWRGKKSWRNYEDIGYHRLS